MPLAIFCYITVINICSEDSAFLTLILSFFLLFLVNYSTDVTRPVTVHRFTFFIMAEQQPQNSGIVQAFCQVYMHIVQNVENVLSEATHSTVLVCISGEIDKYRGLFLQVCAAKSCTW
jgi:hypothetical protein